MATGPKIVHKQFNSPIGLYSQQNIKATLGKHLQDLGNGSVGIDFNNPGTDKPTNLANSAVLRMLEEEERLRKGHPNQKKVVWPPAPETNGYHQDQPNQGYGSPLSPPTQQYSNPQQISPQQYAPSQHSPHYPQTKIVPQYHNQPQYQPAHCEGKRQETSGLSKLIPFGPGVTAPSANQKPSGPKTTIIPIYQEPSSPNAQQYTAPTSQNAPQYTAPTSQNAPQYLAPRSQNVPSFKAPQQNRWAAVPAPVSPQGFYPSDPFSPPVEQPVYQPPQRQFEPPPSTITLRPQPPVHQKAPPVFPSQPAAASFNGGVNMRGDMKWPPQSVREAVEAENDARKQLARGPACRPRKVKKDYSSFFAQNALNSNYPGYRAPPGTQHFEELSGRSSY